MTDTPPASNFINPAALQLQRQAAELPGIAPNGEFFATVGRKYLKNAGLAVFEMLGGVDSFAVWAEKNKSDFYTKIYPKLLDKSVEITDLRTIEDVISDLDENTIDGEYERI